MESQKVGKRPSLAWALLTLFLPIAVFMYGFLILKIRPPLLPLVLAVTLAALLCLRNGYTWGQLQEGMFTGVSRVHIALAILILTGAIIGAWIATGTIPAIIYWGIRFISPHIFLVSVLFLCIFTSMATGTSLGTVGTMGVASMAIGQAFDFPPHITAGAIISGAWFGDKMSPVSDSSNVCAAVCEVPLFSLIFAMFWSTVPALLFSAIAFYFIGLPYANQSLTPETLTALLSTLDTNFNVGFVSLIPPIVLIVLAYKRFPVLPVLMASLVASGLVGIYNGVNMEALLKCMSSGYISKTGLASLDSILSRGGVLSMSSTILLIMLCMSFGGMLEKARVFEAILDPLTKGTTSVLRLVSSTVASSYVLLMGTGSVSLAQVVVGRAFVSSFTRAGIHPVVLARSVEDSATVGSIFVPWSVHSLFVGAVLGVSTFDYAPYAIFNWSVAIVTLLCAATGIGVWRLNGKPVSKILAYHGMASRESLRDEEHAPAETARAT